MGNYKLIMTDLDGTALLKDRCTIPARLLAALERAHAQGIHIVPITGRPFVCLPPILHRELPWKDICVLSNGAEYRRFADKKVIGSAYMPWHHAKAVVDLAGKYNTPIEISVNDKIVMTRGDHRRLCGFPVSALEYHIENHLAAHGFLVDDLNVCHGMAVEKLTMPYVPPVCREELFEKLRQYPVSGVWGSPNGIEVTSLAATKGQGLLWACRYFGLAPEECAAFGDSGNDISMLKLAGLGVAMGDAPDDVKKNADLVTGTNMEDGVAKVIEEYILR